MKRVCPLLVVAARRTHWKLTEKRHERTDERFADAHGGAATTSDEVIDLLVSSMCNGAIR